MALYDFSAMEGTLGEATSGDIFFQLGLIYAIGRDVPPDRVTAHKWFNIAALKGNRDALQQRREIAAEMSGTDVAMAQRAAREWLSTH